MVVDSEIRQENCYYCASPNGLKLDCYCLGCSKSFHPICAYLNGCLFEIKRGNPPRNLDVKVFCKYMYLYLVLINKQGIIYNKSILDDTSVITKKLLKALLNSLNLYMKPS